jgi:hypothetical protein
LGALDGLISARDDFHAFSAVPYGQPLFCHLIELIEGNRIAASTLISFAPLFP